MFAAMLKGEITMPPPPAHAVLPVSADRHLKKTWGDGIKADRMAEYQEERRAVTRENRKRIIRAMDGGLVLMPEIAAAAKVSKACAFELLHQLKDEGYALKVELSPNRFKWVRTSKTLPHAYSTGSIPYGQVDIDSKDPVGKTVFCREGR